jgi:hypothetical protein
VNTDLSKYNAEKLPAFYTNTFSSPGMRLFFSGNFAAVRQMPHKLVLPALMSQSKVFAGEDTDDV